MAIETIQKTMDNPNKDEAKQEGDVTPVQTPHAEEPKTDDVVEDITVVEDNVTISKKEFETLNKKAEDFENSIALKRLAKLGNQEPKGDDPDEDDRIRILEEQVNAMKTHSFNSSLSDAYQTFVQENPWANSDDKFDKIKEKFSTVGTETKEDLISKFELAAQSVYPTEYKQHLEDKITANVMSKKIVTGDGGAANSAGTIHEDNKPKTQEELDEERLGGLLKQNLTWIKK